jgi:hypothetical protein
MFASLALFITANNNTHFDKTKLEVARRVYPKGSYYVTNIYLENDVSAVSYLVKLNEAQFINIKYKETKLQGTNPPAEITVPLHASSSCCSTL